MGRKWNRSEPHSAFSPQLASSDFFLFGALKGQLAGRGFESAEELVEEIQVIPRQMW
jgi:hypothetical protein